MGGSEPSPEEILAQQQLAAQQLAAQQAADQARLDAEQQAQNQQQQLINQYGKIIAHKTNRACIWADAGMYETRIKQLFMVNRIIWILSRVSCENPDYKTYQSLGEQMSAYQDYAHDTNASRIPASFQGFEWDLLTSDPIFEVTDTETHLEVNLFEAFAEYLTTKLTANTPPADMKRKLDEALTRMIIAREQLISEMQASCKDTDAVSPLPVEVDLRKTRITYR